MLAKYSQNWNLTILSSHYHYHAVFSLACISWRLFNISDSLCVPRYRKWTVRADIQRKEKCLVTKDRITACWSTTVDIQQQRLCSLSQRPQPLEAVLHQVDSILCLILNTVRLDSKKINDWLLLLSVKHCVIPIKEVFSKLHEFPHWFNGDSWL